MRKIATGEQVGKAIDDAWRKIQRFTDFARCAPAAIGDDVRGHGGAMFAVAPVNFLNNALAAISAR